MAVWKLWVIVGLVLAVAELLLVPAQFLLIALGVCAAVVGVLTWGTDMGHAAQLAWFAGLSVVLVPVFVHLWRRRVQVRYEGAAGETSITPQAAEVIGIAPLTVKLRGDRFPARATDGSNFEVGEEVQVHGFSGITALVARKS
ncbi:MAG TPA: NfeD family protein [Xanthomonadaceae bacterium]|nr:NfeD family protein [Xanthomonadaceae bacterium]